MADGRLRIFSGPDVGTKVELVETERESVSITLSELMPLLADAVEGHRFWLQDFKEDTVTISTDLYQVILAYKEFRRPTG